MSNNNTVVLCKDRFWDSNLTWWTNQPDLTECFMSSALVAIPCTFLWITLPIYLPTIYVMDALHQPLPYKTRAKMVFAGAVASLQAINILHYVLTVTQGNPKPLVELLSNITLLLTVLLSFGLIIIEWKRGFITSGIQFIFWMLLLLSSTITCYSIILNAVWEGYIEDMYKFITTAMMEILVLIEFLLHCFAENYHGQLFRENTCPELKSSFLSRTLFSWITQMIRTSYRNPIDEENIWQIPPTEKNLLNMNKLEKAWFKEVKTLKLKTRIPPRDHKCDSNDPRHSSDERTPLLFSNQDPDYTQIRDQLTCDKQKQISPSLLKVILNVHKHDLFLSQLFKLISDSISFLGPLLQMQLIQFTEDLSIEKWKGYFFAFLFFIQVVSQSIFQQQFIQTGAQVGIRVKSSIMSLIYKKALTIDSQSRNESSMGEIINLMSVDAQRLQDVFIWWPYILSSLYVLVIAIVMLWNLLGISILAGLGVFILLFPLNFVISNTQYNLEETQMNLKDKRMKIMSELLNGIKVLKLYAWEESFQEKVEGIRAKEIENLRKFALLGGFNMFTWNMSSFLVTLVTFVTYVFLGNVLDASTTFVALTLFNILQIPINILPIIITYIITGVISFRRLSKFLVKRDIDKNNVVLDPQSDYPVLIENASFSWTNNNAQQVTLSNINLKIEEGSLVAIVGIVGSGKSSLISAILGEMDKIQGTVRVKGSIAYVPQEAWIQNATLKKNITFTNELDEESFEKTIYACALKPDIEILPGGDHTEIGEKGINLSGGQKQRVNLARAVYANSDIYLLDDPLSAVDAHVGKHIFNEVIGNEGLLAKKTRILVTHGVQWLPKVDKIIVINEGKITEEGTYDNLLSNNGAFAKFIASHGFNQPDQFGNEDFEAEEEMNNQLQKVDLLSCSSLSSSSSHSNEDHIESTKNHIRKRNISRLQTTEDPVVEKLPSYDNNRLIDEEKVEMGTVNLKVYQTYLENIGWKKVVQLLLIYTLYQIFSVLSNIWLTQWSNDSLLLNASVLHNSSEYNNRRDLYMGVYGGFGAAMAVSLLIYTMVVTRSLVQASARLHHKMLFSIMHAPMAFFDTTPMGRIINRFSHDMEILDLILPSVIEQWITSAFVVIASIIVICIMSPIFTIMIIPIALIYYFIQHFYIPTSRHLQRLDSKTRSPIYAQFSESLAGASTIRAYREQAFFLERLAYTIDHNSAFYYATNSADRWLNLRLDALGGLIVFAASVLSVIERGSISASLVGLSISYALECTFEMSWMVKIACDIETNIVSVERVKEYCEIEQEAEWEIGNSELHMNWPSHGKLVFEGFSVRYRPGLDLVLKNINLKILDQEKVGIVGRTGAGKSSLTLSLFRLIEAASGSITVDGIKIEKLGLHQLRRRLTILPQDPVLFSGSLRMNLDPFNKYNTSEIWLALERAHLKSFFHRTSEQLDYDCGEGGINLSIGQRQLLCLARALLRKSKILVLDEATAAVDLETDQLIQDTIREEFANCTVLTIAHRLNTIMDYDKVAVLDKGKVCEFDSPMNLLQDSSSLFHAMAVDSKLL